MAVLAVAPAAAFGEEPAAFTFAGALSGAGPSMAFGQALMPGVARYAEGARLASPEAVRAREASQHEWEGISPVAASALAAHAFASLVDRPAGGLPALPAGERWGKLISPHAAQISLPQGQGAIVESLAPIALSEGSAGRLAPIELSLSAAHGAFQPRRAAVAVSVPRDLSEGVSLPGAEVSLKPLGASGSGAATASAGVLDGAAVFYGASSMGANTDALARATSRGVELLAMLRSPGPQRLRYRVGLPEGASASQAPGGGGPIRVAQAGRTIALIPAPSALDAEGTPVPVAMTLSGDVLELKVEDQPGRFALPVMVDPEVVGEEIDPNGLGRPGNWHFEQAPGGGYVYDGEDPWHFGGLYFTHEGAFPEQDWAYVGMRTNGDSKIYGLTLEDEINSQPKYEYGLTIPLAYIDGWAEVGEAGVESSRVMLAEPGWTESVKAATVCAVASCSGEAGAAGNEAHFEVDTPLSSSEYQSKNAEKFSPCCSYIGELWKATAWIAEPAGSHATVSYSNAGEVDHTSNVAGTGAWLSAHQGAFEFEARDAGLGVAAAGVEVWQSGAWRQLLRTSYLYPSASCIGVQCSASEKEALSYASLAGLPEGADRIRVAAEAPIAHTSSTEHGEGETTVLVDATPPHAITISGLKRREGPEPEQQPYEAGEVPVQVKASATDGEGSVESSGVQSIELAVDGHQMGRANGSCSPGPCTATGEWTLQGAELGAGMHTIEVIATDYAGNRSPVKTFQLEVYPATPVALGPGSVNPESGDFALQATDVSESGGMGGLSVTRHYDSLNPTEGSEGPLGPQWTLSLGGLASLEVLPDGSVMVVGPEGLTHFEKTASGFEAPPGDRNVSLAFNEHGSAGAPEYLLESKGEATTTRFTEPEGAKSWMPTVSDLNRWVAISAGRVEAWLFVC
ncbi:MAG: DUF6531 domain-containing protein [Solirubrobacteraceae bacterium]